MTDTNMQAFTKRVKLLEEATGLKWRVDQDHEASVGLTADQVRALATLDKPDTRRALHALTDDSTITGGALLGMLKDLRPGQEVFLSFTPASLTPAVVDTLTMHKVDLRNTLGTQHDFQRTDPSVAPHTDKQNAKPATPSEDIDQAKLKALSASLGREFNKQGKVAVARFGGMSLNQAAQKLNESGLSEGRDFIISDAKSGTIEVNIDALPNPNKNTDKQNAQQGQPGQSGSQLRTSLQNRFSGVRFSAWDSPDYPKTGESAVLSA